jgi:hypothetical protein
MTTPSSLSVKKFVNENFDKVFGTMAFFFPMKSLLDIDGILTEVFVYRKKNENPTLRINHAKIRKYQCNSIGFVLYSKVFDDYAIIDTKVKFLLLIHEINKLLYQTLKLNNFTGKLDIKHNKKQKINHEIKQSCSCGEETEIKTPCCDVHFCLKCWSLVEHCPFCPAATGMYYLSRDCFCMKCTPL